MGRKSNLQKAVEDLTIKVDSKIGNFDKTGDLETAKADMNELISDILLIDYPETPTSKDSKRSLGELYLRVDSTLYDIEKKEEEEMMYYLEEDIE